MTLNPGTRLGPYEIVSPLGAGGMGEVYRAKDTRLGREVAIKVLPQHLSSNSEVRARFEREAKTVSSLNHPYICVLYDVGREGSTDYLVMELIEGETLAHRLSKGPMPVADVLKIGAQVADALDRAHRAGVVHRDLKPGNVMLTRSGAKLMDFGLARATGLAGPRSGSDAAAMTHSPTVAQPLTAEGSIVGTFQYMAPEQLEGREIDARTDIWSLGCVLYEMATGKRAFEGETQASLISSIMRDEPRAMGELSPLSPPSLERLVKQCLAKDPMDRWQTAGDVRRELEWIASSSTQHTAPAITRRRNLRRSALGWIAAAVVALLATAYVLVGPTRAPRDSGALMRFSMEAPPGTILASPSEMEISPDGSMIAFVAVDSSGAGHIFVRPLASDEARMLPGTEKGSLPFWSPDSRTVGFFSSNKLRKIAIDSGAPVVLCDAPDARGGAWSKNGVIVFAPNNQGPIARVSANGGDATTITKLNATRGERGHRYPQFLPDGTHFLYVAVGTGDKVLTYRASVDGGDPEEVCEGGSAARWAPPGYLLFLDTGVNSPRRRLLAQRVSADLRASGDRQLVLDPVSATNFGYTNTSADAHGTLVAEHWSNPHQRLNWCEKSGKVLSIAAEDLQFGSGTLSPDGERVAYGGVDPGDVFILDLNTRVTTRLTFENRQISSIVWAHDQKTVAFSRLSQARGWQVYTKATDGTGADSLLFRGPGLFNFATDWSQDGRWIVAQCADSSGNRDLWKVDVPAGGKATVYQHTPGAEQQGSISPDGNWLVYAVTDESMPGLFVQSFPNPGSKYQVTIRDPLGAFWDRSGKQLLAASNDGTLYTIDVSTEGGFRQGSTVRQGRIQPTDAFLGVASNGNMMIGRTKDVSSLSRIEIVLNWTHLLDHAK
jgi:serine/threonine protein kinase/Tol biopolymer transport system component